MGLADSFSCFLCSFLHSAGCCHLSQYQYQGFVTFITSAVVAGSGSDTVQRILEMLKFLWMLCLAMVDSFTLWLNLLTKQYVNTSTVLCEERYLHIHNISQVRHGTTHTLRKYYTLVYIPSTHSAQVTKGLAEHIL